MHMEGWFDEIKRYMRFGPDDESALRALAPHIEPHLEDIARTFYARIQEHDRARQVLESGESSVGRLRTTLREWMRHLFAGPWDDAYFQLRCRIGRAHVRIALPEPYMFGAMNVLRSEITDRVQAIYANDHAVARTAKQAVDRILDLELAIMLNTYREDLEAQQARAERLATFGQLVGSIAHELRNPLGVMESSLYILRTRAAADDRMKKHADRIGEQIALANNIITTLLDMIRDKPLQREPLQLKALLQHVLTLLTVPPGVTLHIDIADAADRLHGDRTQLGQALRNLLENALQAVGGSGRIDVTARTVAGHVELRIADSGPGVDRAIQKRLFEPLISAKPGGIGLGLSLVRRIIERHGGSVRYAVDDRQSSGACFVILLPDPQSAREPSTHV